MTGKIDNSGVVTFRWGGFIISIQLGILISLVTIIAGGSVFITRMSDKVDRTEVHLNDISDKVERIEPRLVRIETRVDALSPHTSHGPQP
jgi:hypothetical protein